MERRGTLLLVEDEDGLRELVAGFLRREGFEVVEARDGREGIERFDGSARVDLALVDLNLPEYSGVEVCRHMRTAQRGQRILVCSASVTPDHERQLDEIGVGHILTKPYHPEVLLAHIALELSDAGP